MVKERYEAARQGEAACKKVIGENQFEAAKVLYLSRTSCVGSCFACVRMK